jgi:4-oxalocrotonate tautomerase
VQPTKKLIPSTRKKKEVTMPYVSIRVAGKLSREQKKNMAKGVTEVIARETAKPESSIIIFIDEESRENIATGGFLLDEK